MKMRKDVCKKCNGAVWDKRNEMLWRMGKISCPTEEWLVFTTRNIGKGPPEWCSHKRSHGVKVKKKTQVKYERSLKVCVICDCFSADGDDNVAPKDKRERRMQIVESDGLDIEVNCSLELFSKSPLDYEKGRKFCKKPLPDGCHLTLEHIMQLEKDKQKPVEDDELAGEGEND